VPKSAAFTQLTSLSLGNIEDEESAEPLQASNAVAVLEMLAHVTSLASRLQTLELTGLESEHPIALGRVMISLSSICLRQIPAIKNLSVSILTMTTLQLVDGMLLLGPALESLQLRGIRLIGGTWQAAFSSIQKELRLKYVALTDLKQGNL
jgi:hypothetical protein